jgi:hypothetical protein
MFEDILDTNESKTNITHTEIWIFPNGERIEIHVNWTQKFVHVDGNIFDLSKTQLYECARELRDKIDEWGKENPFETIQDRSFKVFDGWIIK